MKPRILYIAISTPQIFISILTILVGSRAINQHNGNPINDETSVHHLLPDWAFYVWSGGMIMGGVLAILGIITISHFIERAGCAALSGAGVVYVTAIIAYDIRDLSLLIVWASLTILMLMRYWALGYLAKPKTPDNIHPGG